MISSRRQRHAVLGWVLAFAMAFTQVALASFACPMELSPQAMEQAMEDGACDMGSNAGSRTLCTKSCHDEPQKSDIPALDVPAPAAEAGLKVRPPDIQLALAALPPPVDRDRPVEPPPRKKSARERK